jgi:hypothetical protein
MSSEPERIDILVRALQKKLMAKFISQKASNVVEYIYN